MSSEYSKDYGYCNFVSQVVLIYSHTRYLIRTVPPAADNPSRAAGSRVIDISIDPSIHWPQDRRGQDGISGITKPSAYICNQCKKIVIGSRPDIQQQQKVSRTTHRGSHLVPHKHHHQHQSTATRPARTVVNLTRKGTISLSLSTYTLLLLLLITTPK